MTVDSSLEVFLGGGGGVLTLICFCLVDVQLIKDTLGLIPCGSCLKVVTCLSIGLPGS